MFRILILLLQQTCEVFPSHNMPGQVFFCPHTSLKPVFRLYTLYSYMKFLMPHILSQLCINLYVRTSQGFLRAVRRRLFDSWTGFGQSFLIKFCRSVLFIDSFMIDIYLLTPPFGLNRPLCLRVVYVSDGFTASDYSCEALLRSQDTEAQLRLFFSINYIFF